MRGHLATQEATDTGVQQEPVVKFVTWTIYAVSSMIVGWVLFTFFIVLLVSPCWVPSAQAARRRYATSLDDTS